MSGTVDFGAYTVELTNELGRGTFGSVYLGYQKTTRQKVAVKRMPIKSDLHGVEGMKEIKLLNKMIPHENIVKLEDFFYHDKSFWIIMEFCEAGDLDAYVNNAKPELLEMIRIMYQCACALTHMHEQASPIIHRDIKPANILMRVINGKPTVKLTDLGVSKMIDQEEMMKTAMFTTVVGTPGYMAPEQYEKKAYGMSVDVFAMGLVYLAMLMYKPGPGAHLLPLAEKGTMIVPFGQDMMMKAAMNQPQEPVTKILSGDSTQVKKVKELVLEMVKYNPKDRLATRKCMDVLGKILGLAVAPAPPPARRETRLPTPPSSGDESSSDEEEEELELTGEHLGFALVHAALREALAEQAEAEKRRREVEKRKTQEREVLEGLGAMGMLLQALVDDKFEAGDKVVVDTDMARAKRLQVNHGEWVDGMERYLGQVGTVVGSGLNAFRVKFKDGVIVMWNADLLSSPGDKPLVKPPYAKKRMLDALEKFEQYDLVEVTADAAKLKRLQTEIGVWREGLEEVVEERGVVTRIDSDGDIVVSLMVGGNRAVRCIFHPDCLVKVPAPGGPIEAGDVVYIKEDDDEVKKLQRGHGGWVDPMKSALGKLTMVKDIRLDGKVAHIEVEGQEWNFNVKALVLLAKSEEVMMAILQRLQKKAKPKPAEAAASDVRLPLTPDREKKKCVIQ